MLLACIIASLRTEHNMGLASTDEVLETALGILDDYLRYDDKKWPIDNPRIPPRTPSELCNDFPAVVAREFMRQVRALMRWLGAETETDAEQAEPNVLDTVAAGGHSQRPARHPVPHQRLHHASGMAEARSLSPPRTSSFDEFVSKFIN